MSTPYLEDRPRVVCDTEAFVNYWNIGFLAEDGRERLFELYDGHPLDKKGIATIFRKWCAVTFNGIAYDLPMILYAMSGATNAELKRASDELIMGGDGRGTPHWVFMERMGLTVPDFIDHIDLMQVSPGYPTMPSLKIYAGRLHSKRMQEMPVEIDDEIDEVKRQVIRSYHRNDLDVTMDMLRELTPQIQLRTLMSREYGIDLRSKSDAQIAEAVIRTEVERAVGRRIYKPDIRPGSFKYDVPEFVSFKTPLMRNVLETVRNTKFEINVKGVVEMPASLKSLQIVIGDSRYTLGLGGLHSNESGISHYSDDDYVLIDTDYTSYYPNIILRLGLFPKQMGPQFLKIYASILTRRIAAKRAGDKNTAETLKIVANSSFGQFGNPYSSLWSAPLMIQTTITGQLIILMLIESVELTGMRVVSANTDGFVTRVPRDRRDEFAALCAASEKAVGFTTEATEYKSLHSRDVNTYAAVAVDDKGKPKLKLKGALGVSGPGLPGAAGLKKNPNMDVCTDAVIEYLKNGTPVEDTIEWCFDPRKFVTVRRVKGGAEKDGEKLGKALRWYYSKNVTGGFSYISNGNAVPESIGGKLMMELPKAMPNDIDYDYYVREAYAILQDLGVMTVDPKLRGRTGTIFGRLPDQKTYHLVNAATGIAACGKRRASIRDSWEETASRPDGRLLCSKCRKQDEL